MKYYKSLWIGGCAAVVLLLAVIVCWKNQGMPTKAAEETTAVTIDETAVSDEEFCMVLDDYRSSIFNKYTTEQVNSDDFWHLDVDGQTPLDAIEEKALNELVHRKTVQRMAVERGLLEALDFDEIMQMAAQENAERESAYDSGQIVYGKRNYKANEFYEYFYSNLEAQLINDIIKNDISVSDEECMAYYEENKEKDVDLQGEYSEVKAIVKRCIQDDKAEAYIRKAVDEARVTYQKEHLDRIAVEQLQ